MKALQINLYSVQIFIFSTGLHFQLIFKMSFHKLKLALKFIQFFYIFTWTSLLPSYVAAVCDEPPDVLNADADIQDLKPPFHNGTVIFYSCSDGYVLNSTSKAFAVCISSNETNDWLLESVSCKPTCTDIPVFLHADLKLEGRTPPFAVGDSIQFDCQSGYITEQRVLEIKCEMENGTATWIYPNTQCSPRNCGYPGDIENAKRIGNLFTFPNSVTYKCYEGFHSKQPITVFCSAVGNWIPALPSCEAIVCPLLSHPTNGKVISSERKYNSIARYRCDHKFHLRGSDQRLCQRDATWSGSVPTCVEITCLDPGILPNGRVLLVKDIYTAGDVVIFICNVTNQRLTSKCLEDGNWNNRPPLCEGPSPQSVTEDSVTSTSSLSKTVTEQMKLNPCDDLGDIRNGRKIFTGFTPNSSITYSCEDGYELRGKGTFVCLETGKWDFNKLPICVKPIPISTIVGIVIGIILVVALVVGGYLLYQWRERKLRGYGKKSKALTADATDLEEISGLDKGKKPIPVTVL